MGAIRVFECRTLAEAWLELSQAILADGDLAAYDALPTKELVNVSLVVAEADPDDPVSTWPGCSTASPRASARTSADSCCTRSRRTCTSRSGS